MKNASDFLTTARARFKIAREASDDQYQREVEDLKFQVPEEQWEQQARNFRKGDEESPGRPTLSISKIDQPIQGVLNEAKNARLGVSVSPVNEDATDDTAEILTGIYRRIERDSMATDARMWAFDRALKCGRGFYMVGAKWDEDAFESYAEDDPRAWDQEITIDRIQHQGAVFLDPSATKPDWSDGNYGFIGAWISKDDFELQFPESSLTVGGIEEWKRSGQEDPEWVNMEPGRESAYVIWYWYKEKDLETLSIKVEGPDGKMERRERQREKVRVYHCKIHGDEVVSDPQLWPGKYIPIIPVLGRELQPFDEKREFYGMIHPVKDAQRFFNFAASSLVERMQIEPKAPYIGVTGQFEGHEKKWATINLKNHPYVEYNAVDVDGRPAPQPQRSEVNTQGMTVAMASMQEASQMIHDTLQAGFDPTIGRIPARERSGRAIMALQEQLQKGTSNYLGDFARCSMHYEARVVIDLIPHYYDRPGRITQILGDEDKSEAIMIGQPYILQDGVPAPLPPEQIMFLEQGGEIPGVKTYDFRKGRYTVDVNVGRSHETRLQEGRDEMARMLESQPELWPVLGPLFMRHQDAPWAKEAAKLLTKWRDKQFPGLTVDEDEEQTPEQLQARLAAAEEFIQRQGQELQETQKKLETDFAKQQASMQNAQLKALTDLKTTEMDNQVKMLVKLLEQQMADQDRKFKAIMDAVDKGHESQEKMSDRAHDAAKAVTELEFKAAQGPLDVDDTIR